jgi:hypothetical protein
MYLQEIENKGNNELSFYEGDPQGSSYGFDGSDGFDDGDGFEGDEYTGQGDDIVDFSGEAGCKCSFGTEMAKSRPFIFTVSNSNPTARRVAICPSMFAEDATKVLKEGVINWGGSNNGLLSASGSTESIDFFLAWINKNPTKIPLVKIKTTDTAMFDGSIVLERVSPYGKLGDRKIELGPFVSEKAFNDKILTVPLGDDFQFDDQTRCFVTIPAGTEQNPTKVTFTLFTGANINLPKSLNKKAARANRSHKVIMQKSAILKR